MSRVRSAKKIDQSLRKKGFRREMDGKHIHYFFSESGGKKFGIFTLMSHGMDSAAIGDPLLGLMARQLHITKTQFLDFIDCTLDENGYRVLLQTGEVVP